jgi:hypothetical protein
MLWAWYNKKYWQWRREVTLTHLTVAVKEASAGTNTNL